MTLILIYQLFIQLNEVNCMKLNVIFRKTTVQGKFIDKSCGKLISSFFED